MKKIIINGKKELSGTIRISGAKNAAVAIIPAAIITDEEDSYDLQKELEAKFDELFGPIDEE